MHIAVVGAGFAGTAVAWEALEAGAEVTLFDSGGSASRVSPGLLHPFVGKKVKPTEETWAGYKATRRLLDVADQRPREGIVRLLSQPMEIEGSQWWERAQIEEHLPGCTAHGGLYIPDGLQVDTGAYLDNLWAACEARGAQLECRRVEPGELAHDRIVLCTGSEAPGIEPVKGQILRLRWPDDLSPPDVSIIGRKYLVIDGTSCLVGATYEHDFESALPDAQEAKRVIMPDIAALYPQLEAAPIVECLAGVRASAPGHKPVLKQVDEKTWVFTGLGSKGLLLHAKLAQELVRRIF